jgi:hypothetical protein
MRAVGLEMDIAAGSVLLLGPVTAELDVAALSSWAAGQHLPAIPTIPESIRQRYHKYRTATTPEGGTRP